ncbi:glycosyltransferase family 4 protein [Propionimicrobium lymphophilum]|uniref:glycosyltransferase family 4 protein n=1 Tax=Propionimicrobium lymphophilum TaxID=33012 RepID=UPI00288C4C1C|nr:glycosyltransferase family 4 protein [Propionimicrobium lymphophilum]
MAGKTKKHVVIATRIFDPEPAIAAEIQHSFAKALSNGGYDVTVLTTKAPGYATYSDGDLDVRRWPALRDKDGYIKGVVQYLSFDIPLFFRLLFHRPKPDVVLLEPPPTTAMIVRAVCWLRRIPYVYHVADLWSEAVTDDDAGKLVQKLLRAGEIWALKGASVLMSAYPGMTGGLRGLGIDKNVETIGLGVDTDVYKPEGQVKENLPAKKVLLYAGTASHVHGAEIFVDAFNLIKDDFPEVGLVFVGQGTSFDWLEEQAKKSQGRITVLPKVSSAEAASWLRSAVASLASVNPDVYSFAFPTKAYSAAASGVPVIYTGAETAGKVIQDNGLGCFAEYDSNSVAEAMRQILSEDEDKRLSRKKYLRKWAMDNVALSAIAIKVKKIIDRIASPENKVV